MEKGDVVEIFEDVFSETKFEGNARLISIVTSDPNSETWEVEFLDERGASYIRTIKETVCSRYK